MTSVKQRSRLTTSDETTSRCPFSEQLFRAMCAAAFGWNSVAVRTRQAARAVMKLHWIEMAYDGQPAHRAEGRYFHDRNCRQEVSLP